MITNLDIDSILNRENQEIIEAHKEIVALQKGTGHIIKNRARSFRLLLSRGLNNKMVFVGSP
jgi:hypothetical protein